MEAVTETHQFYDTIEFLRYNFFGHSIVRWQKLQNVYDRYCSNSTLKALNPTRWSGRYDAVFALKKRFCDVMKCLTRIILTSTKPKERDEAMAIKKLVPLTRYIPLAADSVCVGMSLSVRLAVSLRYANKKKERDEAMAIKNGNKKTDEDYARLQVTHM